jgi:tetratricopeptide (TPR) repeat protein
MTHAPRWRAIAESIPPVRALALLALAAASIALIAARPAYARSDDQAHSLDAVVLRVQLLLERGNLDVAVSVSDSTLGAQGGTSPAREQLPALARLLHIRGILDYLHEDFAGAVSWLSRAHEEVVRCVDAGHRDLGPFAAEVLNDHAELMRLEGDAEGAVAAMREAIVLAQAHAPDSNLHAVLLNNLAGLHKDRSAYADAEELLRRALQITERLEGDTGARLATAHLNLAEVYRLQDRHDFAEPHYLRALELAREALGPDDPDLVYFLAQLAALRSEQGQRDAALALREEALTLVARAPRSTRFLEAELLRASAVDQLNARRRDEAIESFRQCLQIHEELFGPDHWITAETRFGLARALAIGTIARAHEEALAHLDATILATAEAAPEVLVSALGVRASLLGRQGRSDAALADLDRATDRLEGLRARRGGGDRSRALLLGRHVDLYHEAIALRIERGELTAAFELVERMRARTLVDELESSGLDLRGDLHVAVRDSLEQRERSARARLVRYQESMRGLTYGASDSTENARLREAQAGLDQALLDLRDVQEEMLRRSPRWRSILESTRTVLSLAQAQELVGDRGVMLVYAIGETRSFVLEVPPVGESVRVHVLRRPGIDRVLRRDRGVLTRGVIERAVHEARDHLLCVRGPCARAREHALAELADFLVPDPLRERLARSELVIVVPDGALHELPFEALVLGSYESGATRTWLTDFGPTLYASSATALAELRARHVRSSDRCAPSVDVLTLSDPDFSRHAPADTNDVNVPRFRVEPIRAGIPAHLPPLPGTRAESAAVSAAFGGIAVVALQGEEATEHAVRTWAPRARYLHLATHGLTSRTGTSALASLVLTAPRAEAAPEDDGLLQLFEIRELALCAELAVLSACETAVGERIEGEGVFALSRGFLTA